MPSPRTLAWIDRLAWTLIYGGLFTLVLGVAALKYDAASAWTLIVAGGVLTAGGMATVWVRSRLR